MASVRTLKVLEDARSILFLGAHCDDIEIGCGGTMLRLEELAPTAELRCVVFSSDGERKAESEAALRCLCPRLRMKVEFESFRNGHFPYIGSAIKDHFESIRRQSDPDLIFTHFRSDLHQDHREISALTWNTFRNHLILEYEIPKFDGDLGSPQVFVPLSTRNVDSKVSALMDCFPSQRSKQWFTGETFRGLMRLRGIECNAQSGFAEAFYLRKAQLT